MNTFVGKKVNFSEDYLSVELEDGRIISTPLKWYPELSKASIEQLKKYKFICKNTGIEWASLDYHLDIESMFLSNKSEKVA